MKYTANYGLPLWDAEDPLRRGELIKIVQAVDENAGFVFDRQRKKFRVTSAELLAPDRVWDVAMLPDALTIVSDPNTQTSRVASNGKQAVFCGVTSTGSSPNVTTAYYTYHYAEAAGFKQIDACYSRNGNAGGAAVSIPEGDDTVAYLCTFGYNGSAWERTLRRIDLASGKLTWIASSAAAMGALNPFIASVEYALMGVIFDNAVHVAQIDSLDLNTGAIERSSRYALPSGINSMRLQDVHKDHVILIGFAAATNEAYVYDYNMKTKGWTQVRRETVYGGPQCWCLYSETAEKWFLYFSVNPDKYAVYSWDLNLSVMLAEAAALSPAPSYTAVTPGVTTGFDPAVGVVLYANGAVHVFDKDSGLPIKAVTLGGLSFRVMSRVADAKRVYLIGEYAAYALDLITGDLRRLESIPGYAAYHAGIHCDAVGAPLVDHGKLLALLKDRGVDGSWNRLPWAAATYSGETLSMFGLERAE